jgi:Tol biopolymer transport system component
MIQFNHSSTYAIRRSATSTLIFAALLPTFISCSAEAPPNVLEQSASADAVSPFTRLVDPSGCVIEQITTADHHEYQVQSASADGRLLSMAARLEGMAENDAKVYEMDLATGEKTDLSHTLTNSGPYSPDGRFNVVAQVTANGKTDIYEYERATGELRAVTSHEDWDWLPNYSPDGRFIVFNSYRVDGQSDIHLFEKSTGTLTRLTEDPRYDAHAQFSPDGKQILYHRQQGTRDEGGYIFDLFVHDMETGQKTQLTDGDYEEGYPAWAPDGRHIVYSSDIGGKHGKPNLYILAPEGETSARLTQGDWKDSYALWSRDGEFIYFNSDRAGAGNIYRMLMDGVECVREDV